MSEINPGDVIEVKTDPGFTLDDEGQTPTDPTTVKLRWYIEGEPPTVWTYPGSPEIEQVSTGVYRADIPVTKVGKYHFRWEGDGGVTAAEENVFEAVSAFGG